MNKILNKLLLCCTLIHMVAYVFISCVNPQNQPDQQPKPMHLSIDGELRQYVEIDGCLYIKGPTWMIHDDAKCSRCIQQRERDMQRFIHMIDSALRSH